MGDAPTSVELCLCLLACFHGRRTVNRAFFDASHAAILPRSDGLRPARGHRQSICVRKELLPVCEGVVSVAMSDREGGRGERTI